MKITHRLIKKRYPKVLSGISVVTLVILVMSFIVYDKSTTQEEDNILKEKYLLENINSVSMVNEAYKIDSSIARSNWKKEKLLVILETENLIEKKKIEEIPDFIKAFLEGISANKTFDIAASEEEWNDGAWVHGFDKETKGIAKATAFIAKPFPTKKLIYFGVGKSTAMISYYTGGIRMVQRVMIIKFEGNKIIDVWFDNNSYGCNSVYSGTKKDGLIIYIKKMSNNNC